MEFFGFCLQERDAAAVPVQFAEGWDTEGGFLTAREGRLDVRSAGHTPSAWLRADCGYCGSHGGGVGRTAAAFELRAIKQRTTWYDLAHEYIEQRWERTPGNTRRTLADAFATVAPALVRPGATFSDPRVLRRALYSWAFNKKAWQCEPAEEWLRALNWMKQNSLPVSAFAEADVLRRALDAMCRKLDDKAAAARQPDARGLRSTKLSTLLWRKGTSRRTPQRSTVESARSQ